MRRFRVRVLVQQKEEEEATTNDRNKKRRASRRGRRPKVVVGQSLFCAQRHRCVVSHTSDDVRDIKVNGNF